MNIQKVASAKSKQVVGHSTQSWTKQRLQTGWRDGASKGVPGTERGIGSLLKVELVKEHVRDLENQHKAKKEAKALDKDFFLSVLHSSATKRDARSYIQQFNPSKPVVADKGPTVSKETCGVNLGSFYGPAAVEGSPRFTQHPPRNNTVVEELQLHLALVKIRAPQTLTEETINGVGRTLSQLERLGLVSVVVVDCNAEDGPPSKASGRGSAWRTMEAEQADRVISAIEKSGSTGARLVDNIVGLRDEPAQPGQSLTQVHITLRKLLMTPLRRGVIPVIPCVGYTEVAQMARKVAANDIILALTREFAGIPSNLPPEENPVTVQKKVQALRKEVSLDRLIILDPLGGIPATNRPNKYHVFLNMEQEYVSARQDLLGSSRIEEQGSDHILGIHSVLNPTLSHSYSEVLGSGVGPQDTPVLNNPNSQDRKAQNWHHLQNLQLARGVLSILPPSSSALLTTPNEAANSRKYAPFQPARVGTRRQRNPLIHNLLTDKPVFSSSLPVGRLSQDEMVAPAAMITPSTFVKHGMSVTIIPNPTRGAWKAPAHGEPHLTLTGSEIDLPRLVHLIEDSFGRRLDVQAYLDRVNDRLAGVIIAGEYEGGALLTWETPPGVPDDGSPESRARMVPYLDKFAVLRRSQGSGGVADLIFKAMVRDCFPGGVVWRSRKNNPVNKWYFERSRGTWKLPETGWTMFWTTPDLSMDEQLFHDYAGVCKSIEPSWADNKALLD